MQFRDDVAIVGGCGHVGLPLGLAFASRGLSVVLYDINSLSVDRVNKGEMPFSEPGAAQIIEKVVGSKLVASSDPSVVSGAEHIVVTIGTPVDEHLNPDPNAVLRAIEDIANYLVDGQLLTLRSTVYPGTTALAARLIGVTGMDIDVAFCPERIAEGKAMEELFKLPQLVSGCSEKAVERAARLFGILAPQILRLDPEEAELAKLFTNTWRYIRFATANQLFMMANDFQLDYEKIRLALTQDYPRAADLPSAGFAAGPCLFKDTMQLAAFNNNNFVLGHAAMLINEGLPLYIVSKLELRYRLLDTTIGILGMAFKGESDDCRSSLSYKLKRILRFKTKGVVCHDPFVSLDDDLVPLDEVLSKSDVLIIAAPHEQYRRLDTDLPVIDIWGLTGRGTRV